MLIKLEFSDKGRSWMKACVFAGNLAVLMNGSPAHEIGIKMGLKQEYPLVHFIFILVVEGLSGLVVRTKELDLYSGFKVNTSGFGNVSPSVC